MTDKLYRFLLVEDNKIAQRVGIHYLKSFSDEVHLAKNAEEAIELSFQIKFDLIFLDIGLPDGDGREVARLIRNNNYNQKTPILAVTAHADWEKESCLSSGINQVYPKPLSPEMIIKIMNDFGL